MAAARNRFYRFFMGCILEDGEGKIQPSTPPVEGFSKEDGMVRHPPRPKVGQNIGPLEEDGEGPKPRASTRMGPPEKMDADDGEV